MNIVLLDAKTLGDDISLDKFKSCGEFISYQTTSKEQTLDRVKGAEVVITNKVVIDREIMENSQIKLICVAATGMNNIDLEYAKEQNIVVKNVAGYSTNSVVQLTFSHLFYLLNKLRYFDEYSKNSWSSSDIFTHLGEPFSEIASKKWGIIGLGEIGKKVAQIAQTFGAEVVYYSTSGKNKNTDYKNVDLETLLKESDIISIHCPLNAQTLNLLDKNNLPLLKDETILINMGRGGIINEEDLGDAIDNQNIYVGTDVISSEPIPKNSPYLSVKNQNRLFITPHIAWASKEARERLVVKIIENITNFNNR